jgi:hypothetical protein
MASMKYGILGPIIGKISNLVTYIRRGVPVVRTKPNVYYDADWKTTIKANASYYRIVKLVEESKKYEVTDFYMSGKIQMTGTFSSMSPEIKDGILMFHFGTSSRVEQ